MLIAQVDWEGGLSEAWQNVTTFVPALLGFLLILLIGWFIAKALARLTDALLERVGFDRWVERGALKPALERSKFDASDIMSTIVFWVVFLVVLQLAFGVFGPNPVSQLLTGLIAYLPNVFAAVLIVVIASALAKVVNDLLSATLGASTMGRWIARGAGGAILIVGIFAALNQLRVAPEIVNGLFYALLVVIVGSAVIAFGVGGIPVARRYLDQWSTRAEEHGRELKATADTDAPRRRAEEATRRMDEGETGARRSA
jgi:hypothetical protein